MSFRQRVTDYLRERRIRKLADEIERLRDLSAHTDNWIRELRDEMDREIQKWLQDQIARLETAKKLRP